MGRRVFVTEGTGALGSAVTRRLLEDGHRVAVTCLHDGQVGELRDALGDLHADLVVIEADVTNEDSFGGALTHFHSQLGSVEALVHLVGAWHGGEPVQDQSLEGRGRHPRRRHVVRHGAQPPRTVIAMG